MKNLLISTSLAALTVTLLPSVTFSQGTSCSNATPAPSDCTTGYLVSNTVGISASPQCVGNVNPSIDGWFTWTPTAGTYDIDLGGGGGGKDDFAQGGGADASKLDAAISSIKAELQKS